MENKILSSIRAFGKKKPGKEAIITPDETLSYAQLISSSQKLALILHKKGIKQGDGVGIFLTHCGELPISILAIWMIGAFYVPLDPIYPLEKISQIVGNVNLSYILTTRSNGSIPNYQGSVIYLEEVLSTEGDNLKEIDLPATNLKNGLAYVIFTSGTTGNPKGVKIPISSLWNLLSSFQKKLETTLQDRLLAITPISFDIFGLELLLPLISGGSCFFTKRSTGLEALSLIEQFKEHKISLFQATPATYQLLTDVPWPRLSLRHLLCGGEAWDQKLAKTILEKIPRSCTLWNVYGPTETTIWSSATKVSEGDIFLSPSVDKTRFFILNDELQPAKEGELYIGGAGVSTGYYRNEPLTKKSFITCFGMTLYKTGDFVRQIAEQKWIFLGRKDQQVKIRGFRVELGEIEYQLRKHPKILRVVAIYNYFNYTNEKSLIVCIETRESRIKNLREFLKLRVPSYMIPQFFVQLEKFPLTPNGKIDRLKITDELKNQLASKRRQVNHR